MPTFLYVAKDKNNKTDAGQMEAVNKHELAALLRNQGSVLISAETVGEKRTGNIKFNFNFTLGFLTRISLVEKMMFTQHLAVMIEAGLSLNQALKALIEQTKNLKFKRIIDKLEQSLRQGKSFSNSLAQYPKVFNQLYVNMVRVGETSGNLDNVLKILTSQMKKEHELMSRVKGAMIYPAVIIISMIGIGILMMIMVVPKLTAVFDDLDMELPLTTRIVIGFSDLLKNNLISGLIALVGFIFFIKFISKIKIIKYLLHGIYLRLPIFGQLIRKINSARFARTLSSLIESGVPIVEALGIVAGTLNNLHFKRTLINSAKEIQKGKELSTTLMKHKKLYTPMVIQMISVGEKTGNLTKVLKHLANFYETEVDNMTKNLSAIIEPVLMIVIGAAVGFFAVSMIKPMYSMMSGI